ncbi:MAG: single-stranded DNA-binding protein [Methylocystis sp.]|uniref:single-stranded DNA-binding protein n=1 Tax=Methylocystis sp. TaxID=1911079 RepID=UPI00395174C5
MTAHVLIQGALYRTPERKTSRAGKSYVSATIRVRDGEGSQFWRVTIFSESASEEIMRLSEGDAVSVQGAMRAELYRPDDGEPRLSFSLVADRVLALQQPPRKPEKQLAGSPNDPARTNRSSSGSRRASGHRSPSAPHGWHAADTDLNDDIPL